MITGTQIVQKAREYLGTPFRHQGRKKVLGIDCAGLVICVAKELNITNFETFEFVAYGHIPHARKLETLCDMLFERITMQLAKPGDIFLMAFEKEPQHLAIMTDTGIIHSYAKVRRCVEHGFDELWQNRVNRVYRFIGVEQHG